MEIKIVNFGPIGRFEFDLSKDLIVTYGKNNIGKSYAMAILYLFLKHLLPLDPSLLAELIRQEVSPKKMAEIERAMVSGADKSKVAAVHALLKDVWNKIMPVSLENGIKNTFGDLAGIKNYKGKGNPLVEIAWSGHRLQVVVGASVRVKQCWVSPGVMGEFLKGAVDFHGLKGFIEGLVRGLMASISEEVEGIYFLPASRSGLYTASASFFPIFAQLSKMRSFITEKIQLPAMTEPIADFILNLADIRGRATTQKALLDIVNTLEKEILKGVVGFDMEKKRITYTPIDTHLVLDMSVVSSMVSELSPVVAFIKYILPAKNGHGGGRGLACQKPVIFIEEPEAHLHPEAQVQLAVVFVQLIRAGVKLVISSHSSYIFNKLSNMSIERVLDGDKYAPLLLTDTAKGSVSKVMAVDDLGVEDENFVDTAIALYEERERILDQWNQGLHD